jgi:hypothetical protein
MNRAPAMTNLVFQSLCNSIADEVARLLPEILKTPEDFNIKRGNCTLCIMNAAGDSFAKMFGDNPLRQRESAQVAWKKALQVWITGYATGDYETLVYSKQVDEEKFGIARPEFIGWYGGVEAITADGERLVLAFSGVRGEQDVSILHQAAKNLKSFSIAGN